MGETRVDLLHLLEDLRDAYPGSIEETILTEIVANSLDSGARRIRAWADPASATLTVVDDGAGMSRQALTRYHDLAATGKRKGRSIGFAGVGIKLGLLVSAEVVTEARRVRTHLATSWRLASRSRAPWRWVEPAGLLDRPGTAVRLYLSNALSPLLEPGRVEEILLRNFQPLLDPDLDSMLAGFYPHGVTFEVNGRALPRSAPGPGRVKVTVRLGRQRKPTGLGYLVRDPNLAEDETGIAVSTLGKVIKRGWDWLGLAPAPGVAVGGLIEVPALAEALTLNKADFIRTGARGATFLAYRKAMQEVVGGQLADWGTEPKGEPGRQRRTRPLERDLQGVLLDLSAEFPLLATLVERQTGGQKGLPFGGLRVAASRGAQEMETPGGSAHVGSPDPVQGGAPEDSALLEASDGVWAPQGASLGSARSAALDETFLPGGRRTRKPGHYGLRIRFEERPEHTELGRLIESTVWVNAAHPAYLRASASRSEGYHLAVTVAMALAPLAVEPERAHGFVTAFLARWGDASRR
ncbi:MAG: ATP-binding protein [Longimicrobiales bacterium]|nr:ATP-binding protein [Longimicrobiales bacterium]